MKMRHFILAKLHQLLDYKTGQGVKEVTYKRRKYILSFTPSIQHLVLDAIYDFLKFNISCRSQDNYLGSVYL